ncbi:MAG: putative toxin-antitoxin system toxin component, PIN family [Prevotella sp.]|nr:putative toxin-antitoxin system toxin component, PIN family [Prevotella sp.]
MSDKRRIVLDTNCLVASLSRHSEYFPVWLGIQAGKYILCVSNEILEEYQEVIEQKTTAVVARNVVNLLLKSRNVLFITPHFKFHLIEADHDDDKFVDCAFAANATYIVSDDKHFDVLRATPFPELLVIKLREFLSLLLAGK